MKMKAAVLNRFHSPLELQEVPVSDLKPDEALVAVKASGLCGSDIHIMEGKVPTVTLPFIPGHEMAGEVVRLGSDAAGLNMGDHVVSLIDITCGSCRFCLKSRSNLCLNLKRLGFERNGSHAQFAVVPIANLVKIPKGVPFEQAAIIPDAVSCMLHAVKVQGKVGLGDKVVFLGIGGLGMQGVQIAKRAGAEVYCTSRRDDKLKVASKLGADAVINTRKQDLGAEVQSLTGGVGCDVVFDNIGTNESMKTALSICSRGGKVVVVGYTDRTFEGDLYSLMILEKEIIGTRASTKADLTQAVELVEKGLVTPYVSDTFSFEEINDGLKKLGAGDIMGRGVLIM